MDTPKVLVFPVVAKPTRFVGTPGSEAGVKVAVPSMAEVAVEVWDARSSDSAHRPWGGQGGAHAYKA